MRTITFLACLLLACGGSSSSMMGPADMLQPTVPDAANALPESDPRAAGQHLFLFETWGGELGTDWPPVDFMLGLMKSEPDVFGNQFASFGFLPDPSDDLPIGLKRGTTDPTRLHQTCAVCHVGILPDGRMWFGAPAATLDITRFTNEVNTRWVAAGHPALVTDLEIMKNAGLGPGRIGAESGIYPKSVPTDFPHYFTLGERTHLNYLGTGQNITSEASLSIFSFGAGDPSNPAMVPFPADGVVATFVDFFGTMASPLPPAGDAAAIARGQTVFTTARCDACHHVADDSQDGVTPVDAMERIPGDDPMWPRGSIATDLTHRLLEEDPASTSDEGRVNLLHFIGTHMLKVGSSDGYAVRDLHGLWATAPYLHNGSVPTVEALLQAPADRPKSFLRGSFTVDTSTAGNTNVGHAFGTTLSATDKSDLVAYLKSL